MIYQWPEPEEYLDEQLTDAELADRIDREMFGERSGN